MQKVFEYTDYRKFLKDYYTEAKGENHAFSYRALAKKVGFKSAGHFTQILSGTANISALLIKGFTRTLGLKKREADYFRAMVLFNQAKTHSGKKQYFETMTSFRESAVRIVAAKQYEFYERWYYSAVREVLDFYPFDGNDFAGLARIIEPSITAAEAKTAVRLLDKLGFIRPDADGWYKKTDAVISTGYEAHAVAINNQVLNTLRLAGEAIDRFPRDERNLSWLTMSLSRTGFESVQEELRSFRRRALEIARNDESANRVYQFNYQVFPLSKPFTKERG